MKIALAVLILSLVPAAHGQYQANQQQANGRDFVSFPGGGRSYSSAGWGGNGRNYVPTIYPAGTVWREAMGNNLNGYPCWSGATGTNAQCTQTFDLASGSGETVTAANGCGSNAPFANAIELPAATTPVFYAYVPLMSQSTANFTYDFYAWVCYSSTAGVSFDNILQFGSTSSYNQAANVYTDGSGSGKLVFASSSSSGTAITAAAGAWHLLHFHLVGGSSTCYGTIDNSSSTNTLTCASSDFYQLVIAGAGSSANFYWGPMWITQSSLGGGWPPTSFMDSAGGTNGTTVTTANLATATHCVAPYSNPPWTINLGGSTAITFSTAESIAVPVPVAACGAIYTGNTGVSLHYHNAGSTADDYLHYNFYTFSESVMMVVYYYTPSSYSGLTYTDQLGIDAPGGAIAMHVCESNASSAATGLCQESGGTGLYMFAEADGTNSTTGYQVSTGTWYQLVFLTAPGGYSYLTINSVNQSTGAVTGTLGSFTLASTAFSGGQADVWFGNAAETPTVTMDSYVGPWWVNYMNGAQTAVVP